MPIEEKTEQCNADEKVIEIEVERLRSFSNHPFKVQADSQMIELQDSIKKYGILNPLIVRPTPEGVYEIISGHRRKFAAERLGYRKVPVIIRVNVMESELFYRIVEEARDMNIIHISLSGGEPLLHRDIIGFLRKCKELDLSVNILSNLTVLTEEVIQEMKNNPLLSVQTSIYSMNPAIHDAITMLPGSLEKTVLGLKKLIEAKIPVQISCPVMKANKDDFVSVIKWGYNNNISVAVEPVIFASYDHTGDNLANRLSLEEIGKAFDYQLQEGYGDPIRTLAREKESMTGEDPICSICRYSFCISVKGEVYPCVGWQTNIIGDMKESSLCEIWEKSEKIQCLRKIKRKNFSQCVDCKDRGYCTVCMMSNSNENQDGDAFKINPFHCKVAELKHKKVSAYMHGE